MEAFLESLADLVTVVEIEPETFWFESGPSGDPYHADPTALERLRSFPEAKLVHGVGFPVGGSRVPDPRHLPLMAKVIEDLGSPWTSEHLSFNQAESPGEKFHTGFLLPPLQTPEGAEAAAASIREVVKHLPVPFAVETGVNYLHPRDGELSDGAFVSAVVSGADCGILLDLHNIWANERNGRQSVDAFLSEIPLERVWEVHLAGGLEHQGYWLDAHSGEVPAPLADIAARVLPALPNVRALIFEMLPTFFPRLGIHGVRKQVELLHGLWALRRGKPAEVGARPQPIVRMRRGHDFVTPAAWEDTLGALVIGKKGEGCLAAELAADPGARLLQNLVRDFRAGMIVSTLKLTSRLLMLHGGKSLLRNLLNDFWSSTAPKLFSSSEAQAFADYLEKRELEVPHLAEVLAFERAVIHTLITGETRLVRFRCDPMALLQALGERRLPDTLLEGNYEVEVTPETGVAFGVDSRLFGPLPS